MRQFIKNNMIGFLLGALIFGGVGVYALDKIHAKDVSFSSSNSNFMAENVNNALDTLYEKTNLNQDMNIANYDVLIHKDKGGEGYNTILTNGRSKLSIGSRTYTSVAGTTYFNIMGYYTENGMVQAETLLHTTSPSSVQEVFDISKYDSITIAVACNYDGDVNDWSKYTYSNIRLYNE